MTDWFRYAVYGVSLSSEIELALPEHSHNGLTEIEICRGQGGVFEQALEGGERRATPEWYSHAHLSDGATYLQWRGVGEFLISSDGRRITCARDPDAPLESFQVYLTGQALGFALVKKGFEPLHAAVVAVDGEAVAILGASGFGKSSLAACFLGAGYSLVTDDLLLVEPVLIDPGMRGLEAHSGPARIKLFPAEARQFLGPAATGVRMNSRTSKMVIPISQWQAGHLPLRAIYVLASPEEAHGVRDIRIERLSPNAAFLALVANMFNYLLLDPERLRRQAIATAEVARAVPVKKLSYPRGLDHLPAVRKAVVEDLRR